jgi:acetyl-CoA carboxylase biotin carboxyl carrier protein
MPISTNELKEILAILEASGWDEAQVTIGDVTLTVSKSGLAGAPAGAPARAAAITTPELAPAVEPAVERPVVDPGPHAADVVGYDITAPSLGVFWRAPEPGTPPFVDVGSRVEAGDTLCIVEVMKLMNQVRTDRAGVVVAVHPQNGEHVEFGNRLFTLDPDPV